MKYYYLAIGDELLKGESREGNGPVLAAYLQKNGAELTEIRVLSDELDTMLGTIKELSSETAIIVTSGGLGPTDDDRTREAVALACGVELETSDRVLDRLRTWAELRGREMAPSNLRQAQFPAGSNILENEHGTAPGFSVNLGASTLVSFPGVPREFREMVDAHMPAILQSVGVQVQALSEITLRIFGITESGLQSTLREIPGYEGIRMRSLPTFPEIRLVLSASEPGGDVSGFAEVVKQRLDWRVFSEEPRKPYAQIILDALADSGETFAAAESCTGGLIAHMLTAIPGASRSFMAAVVSYSNESKSSLLGVPEETLIAHGAVSAPTAAAMAEGARARCGASVGLSVTGIAGPGGGSDEKPVGTFFVGLSTSSGTQTAAHCFPGLDRSRFQRLVAYVALNTVRRHLSS